MKAYNVSLICIIFVEYLLKTHGKEISKQITSCDIGNSFQSEQFTPIIQHKIRNNSWLEYFPICDCHLNVICMKIVKKMLDTKKQ